MRTGIFNKCFSSCLVASLASSILINSAAPALAQATPGKEVVLKSKPPWQRVLQGDDAKWADSLEKQIADLEKKGRFAEAIAPAREVLAIRNRVQGQDHWETVNARIEEQSCTRVAGLPREAQSELAAAIRHDEEIEQFHQKGRFAEAEPLIRSVIDTRRKILGEDHPNTARIYNGLTENLDAQGRYEEARPFCLKALEIDRHALGENHPYTAASYNDLAANLDGQGLYAEAEPHYRRALEINLHTQGEYAPRIADACDNLGLNLRDQGKYAEAQPFLHKALEIHRRAQGEISSDTARSYNNLAYDLTGQGKDTESEPLLRRALEIYRLASGEDHPDTALAYNNLGDNLAIKGSMPRPSHCFRRRWTSGASSSARTTSTRPPDTATWPPIWRGKRGMPRLNLCTVKPWTSGGAAWARATPTWQSDTAEWPSIWSGKGSTLKRKRSMISRWRSAAAGWVRNTTKRRGATRAWLSTWPPREITPTPKPRRRAATRSYEAARLRVSFTGMGRIALGSQQSPLTVLAALLARQACDADAWQRWESGLARGLFDDLAARRRPLTLDERRGHDELASRLDRLDNQISARMSVEDPTNDQRKQLEELKSQRLDLQGRLVQLEAEVIRKYKATAGAVYDLDQIQARIPADAALVGWLDLKTMPNTADPRGDHWACVVRRIGVPQWIRIVGIGPDPAWRPADEQRPGQVRQLLGTEIEKDWQTPLAMLAQQRLGPLETALEARDGLPSVRHLDRPAVARTGRHSRRGDGRGPSAGCAASPRQLCSLGHNLRLAPGTAPRGGGQAGTASPPAGPGRPRAPGCRHVQPACAKPPNHGLLVQQVEPGSNAEQAGIRPGDILLQYGGARLAALDDLEKQVQGGDLKVKSIAVAVWRDNKTFELTLRPGPLGVVPNTQPAPQALLAQREGDISLRRSRGADLRSAAWHPPRGPDHRRILRPA